MRQEVGTSSRLSPQAYSIPNPPYYFSGRLTIDPITPSTIYIEVEAAGGASIFKSTDGGQTWNRLNISSGAASSVGGLVVRSSNFVQLIRTLHWGWREHRKEYRWRSDVDFAPGRSGWRIRIVFCD